MRAVRFHGKNDIRVEDIPEPQAALADDDVLIAPLLCGICGTDLHEYIAGPIVTPVTPNALSGATLPQVLGHEFSARVIDVGRAVRSLKAGDRVSIQPLVAPPDDYYARRGLNHLSRQLAVVGLSWPWGGMGERAVVKAANAVRVPDGLSDTQAALIEPGAVAVYAVDRGRVAAGSSVLVSGAGPIGALTLLAAKAAGASKLFVSETNPHRLARMKEIMPEAIAINPKVDDLLGIIGDNTEEGVGVDTALECVGAEASLNICAEAVRRRGTVVQAGLHLRPATIDAMLWALKDISVEATWCFHVQSWHRVASMIEAGIFPVEKIVSAQIDAADVVRDGFEALLDPAGRQLKILVKAAA